MPVLAALALLATTQTATSLDEIIDRVQKVYQETRNFRAEFRQTLTLRATRRKRRAGGRVFFQKPYMFRFVYTQGQDRKVIVSDGKTVWTFLRDEGQVRIDPFSRKLGASLRFLWGEGNLREQFEIKKLEGSGFGRAGDPVIELTPRADEGHYRKLVFVIDPRTWEVRETVVYDPVGNVNHMAFSRVRRNIAIDARAFRFQVPKGAQVIRSPEVKRADP
jgi:outer membrane lipoprotein carrier protein